MKAKRRRMHGKRTRKRSPMNSVWAKKGESIAPKKADTSAFKPKKGSFADKVVSTIAVPTDKPSDITNALYSVAPLGKFGKASILSGYGGIG